MPSLDVTINSKQGADKILLTKKAVNKLLDNRYADPADVTDADACEASCNVIKSTARQIQIDEAKAATTLTDL